MILPPSMTPTWIALPKSKNKMNKIVKSFSLFLFPLPITHSPLIISP